MRLEIRGEYPPDWKEISVGVKSAADFRCIRCGHPDWNYNASGSTNGLAPACDRFCRHRDNGKQRRLTVHHMDGDKANCSWWNLLALCQVCHLSVQGRLLPERQYFLEHSEWARVYVGGFYAFYYGGQQVTRPDVELNVHGFLALGQPYLYPDVAPALERIVA